MKNRARRYDEIAKKDAKDGEKGDFLPKEAICGWLIHLGGIVGNVSGGTIEFFQGGSWIQGSSGEPGNEELLLEELEAWLIMCICEGATIDE